MTGTRAILEALYARVPAMQCIPGCTDCCGRTTVCRVEVEGLTAEEDLVRSQLTYACPFVSEGKDCAIHGKRWLICRMFGTNPLMRCPRGAKSEVQLTPAETLDILTTYKEQFFER